MKCVTSCCLLVFAALTARGEDPGPAPVEVPSVSIRRPKAEAPNRLLKPREWAASAAFSPDGRWLALVGGVAPIKHRKEDGLLGNHAPLAAVWSTETWSRIDLEVPPTGVPPVPPINCVFSWDSEWLAVLTLDRRLHVYRFRIEPRRREKQWLLFSSTNLGGMTRVGNNLAVERGYHDPRVPMLILPAGERLLIPSGLPFRQNVPPQSKVLSEVEFWQFPFSPAVRPEDVAPEMKLKHSKRLEGMGLVSGGKRLATVVHGEPTVQVWNVETGEKEREFRYDKDVPESTSPRLQNPHQLGKSLACSPDGELIAVGMEVFLGLFRPDGARVAYRWRPKNLSFGDITFHPSGRWIVAPGSETDTGKKKRQPRFLVWSVPNLELVASMERKPSHVMMRQIAFSPDGEQFVTTGYEARVWSFREMLALEGIDMDARGAAVAELPQ